ncbi:MAG: STAS domain-containing protein [Proteobacteria bacterium]|nr:STAS domain-containing protein [Pseudomonadota bacterium]
MSVISISEGRLCIIKAKEINTVKDGLEKIKSALADFTSKTEMEGKLDSYIFIDFSPFNIINSSVVGVLGSVALDPRIKLIGLCGLQPSVKDILERFGVIHLSNQPEQTIHSELQDNLRKIKVFESIEDGLVQLNPH